jgi:hypothetical protein
MSQGRIPPGIGEGLQGPLFHVQNALNATAFSLKPELAATPVKNGITIFPGGVPLYKNGSWVGGIGVSGDGVDQDDIIAYAGTANYRPADTIRSDHLASSDAINFLVRKLSELQGAVPLGFDAVNKAGPLIQSTLPGLRLPYVKFPRNPNV